MRFAQNPFIYLKNSSKKDNLIKILSKSCLKNKATKFYFWDWKYLQFFYCTIWWISHFAFRHSLLLWICNKCKFIQIYVFMNRIFCKLNLKMRHFKLFSKNWLKQLHTIFHIFYILFFLQNVSNEILLACL